MTRSFVMKFSTQTVQSVYDSPLGRIILAASDDQLVGLWFDGQRHQVDNSQWDVAPDRPIFQTACAQLSEYFAGRRSDFDIALNFNSGSVFQRQVWQALRRIPYGVTLSYGALSASIGKPAAVRAVGAAIGRNPLSIIVPCHRVLGAQGSLTGYAGGIERKQVLLQLEGALP
jgi:methylated-DNA-[protein]-cysteine S-methyltransferase